MIPMPRITLNEGCEKSKDFVITKKDNMKDIAFKWDISWVWDDIVTFSFQVQKINANK